MKFSIVPAPLIEHDITMLMLDIKNDKVGGWDIYEKLIRLIVGSDIYEKNDKLRSWLGHLWKNDKTGGWLHLCAECEGYDSFNCT
jgi:hypothetical protein